MAQIEGLANGTFVPAANNTVLVTRVAHDIGVDGEIDLVSVLNGNFTDVVAVAASTCIVAIFGRQKCGRRVVEFAVAQEGMMSMVVACAVVAAVTQVVPCTNCAFIS